MYYTSIRFIKKKLRHRISIKKYTVVDLLKAEEGGSGERGEAGVDVNSISVLGQTLLEHHRVGLHQKALHSHILSEDAIVTMLSF